MPRRFGHEQSNRRHWKVGELAARTGLTVRTLHHYDRLGLVSPTERTDSSHGSGHRLYNAADIARLQQVLSLKQLGFSLEQVHIYLCRKDYDPRQVVELHLQQIRGQAAELERLEKRLLAIADCLEKAEVVSADEFLSTIEEITMIEKYYTPEQLELLQQRRTDAGAAGDELVRQGPQMWSDLQNEIQAAMEAGVEPTSPRAHELAHRWITLVNGFTGGDPGLFNSLKRMYQNEETVHGMNVAAMRPGMEWVEKAAAAAGIIPIQS